MQETIKNTFFREDPSLSPTGGAIHCYPLETSQSVNSRFVYCILLVLRMSRGSFRSSQGAKTMASASTLWTFVFLTTAIIISCVSAHSNVGQPLAYAKTACKASESWCKGACPPVTSSARSTIDTPVATWQRGQTVEIIWHKNNHWDGFYRRSLVPISSNEDPKMFDEEWHKRTAFDHGCWTQGEFQSGQNDVCGADQRGRSYKNSITIPSIYPDGDYIFGQLWYGGCIGRDSIPSTLTTTHAPTSGYRAAFRSWTQQP